MSLRVLIFALTAGPAAGFAPAAGLPRGAACAARASPLRCQLDAGDKGPMKMAVMADGDADADTDAVPKGRFIAWVKSEQELKEWKKANPIDPVQTLKGPLTSVVILTAGFYTIPLVRGISEGFRSGDMAGSVLQELTNPSGSGAASVDAAPAVTSAVDQVDGGLVNSVLDAIDAAVHSGASP